MFPAKQGNAQASLGCFILATNELDQDCLDATKLLSTYKSQQQVEGGFRFLKSPDFLVSSLYLKKAERIGALLMVATAVLVVGKNMQTIFGSRSDKIKTDMQQIMDQS